MSRLIRAIVALDEAAEREAAAAWLSSDQQVQIVGFVEDLGHGWDAVAEVASDVLIVVCAGYSDRALYYIDGSARQRPERPVVVLCSGSPNGFVRQVFEAGADDIVVLPDSASPGQHAGVSEQIRFTLQKTIARKHGTAATSRAITGEMICVLGPKGGTGKTLTASNLAVSLASAGNNVVIVDLDLQFGDVGLALGLDPDRTIFDLATSSGSLDDEKLDDYLVPHSSGARALLAPVRPEQAGAIKVEFLREVFSMLRATHDHVIFDTPPGFTPEVIASIDASSYVCMVCTLDALSLKNTRLGLEALELMGYDEQRIRLVLNRADSRMGISDDDVLAILGRQPEVLVPSHRDVARSISNGEPISATARGSEAAKAFAALAKTFTHSNNGAGQPDKASSRRRVLRRRG
jgi:pilus assembly protein CpaE